MTVQYAWRGPFVSSEANDLHAEAFGTRVFSDDEWDWRSLLDAHSLGWVTAREAGRLVGFVNVVGDGAVHAWLQDVMVASDHRHQGIGVQLFTSARDGAKEAGCEWLHVDFTPGLRSFYVDACGFTSSEAGLMRLR